MAQASTNSSEIIPSALHCEALSAPLGLQCARPRFSWEVTAAVRGTVQAAYRVLVAASPESLADERELLWDSGRVASEESIQVPYEGSPLASGRCAWWKVRCWNAAGTPGPWSVAARFEMGLLCQGDWQGQWIGAEETISAPLFRRTFTLKGPVRRARAYVCGLGFYESHLNGHKVGDHVLDPGWTDYDDRTMRKLLYPYRDNGRKRVLYATYDVTDALAPGANAVGVWLGNGWYNQRGRTVEGELWYGTPRLILQMNVEYADGSRGSVVSDGTWRCAASPITANNIFYGEVYDARLERDGSATAAFDDSDWAPVGIVRPPTGRLVSQVSPPDKVIAALRPVGLKQPQPGVFVYDMGENFSGWARLRVLGPAGTKVTLRFAEEIDAAGMLDFESAGGKDQVQSDTYILRGDAAIVGATGGCPPSTCDCDEQQGDRRLPLRKDPKEVYEPRFIWHAFRYVEVTGFPGAPNLDGTGWHGHAPLRGHEHSAGGEHGHATARGHATRRTEGPPDAYGDPPHQDTGTPDLDAVEGVVVHAAIESAGEFRCSCDLLNTVEAMVRRTHLAAMHGGVTMDCPHRERLGYTGDGQLTAETALYHFDAGPFFAKWIDDIFDAQNRDTGFVPHTAPFYGGGGGPAWGAACVIIPWALYQFSGDRRVLEEHYARMKAWLAYLGTCTDGGDIVVREEPGSWCLGDWCVPAEKMEIPPELVNTYFYALTARRMAAIAHALGEEADVEWFEIDACRIEEAFHRRFYRPDEGCYAAGIQGCDAIGLAMNPPDPIGRKVIEHLVATIRRNQGHLDTGILATPILLDVLARNGHADLAVEMLLKTTYPGYGYMIERGATTLWESWNGAGSHCHPMFGSVSGWFYRVLAGIRCDPAGPGFRKIVIMPTPCGGLTSASASVRTLRGTVAVAWRRDGGRFSMRVTIPGNSTAQVAVPTLGAEDVQVTEGGCNVWRNGKYESGRSGLRDGHRAGGFVIFTVGGGTYEFQLTPGS